MKCAEEGCRKLLAIGQQVLVLPTLYAKAKCQRDKEPGADSNGMRVCRGPHENSLYNAAVVYTEAGYTIPASSKLTTAMSVILSWQKESPKDKIIGTGSRNGIFMRLLTC
jgi:hypothetical protein